MCEWGVDTFTNLVELRPVLPYKPVQCFREVLQHNTCTILVGPYLTEGLWNLLQYG